MHGHIFSFDNAPCPGCGGVARYKSSKACPTCTKMKARLRLEEAARRKEEWKANRSLTGA